MSLVISMTLTIVHNYYVVILGGHTGMHQNLSSVDIMDTIPPHNNNGEPMIVAGPCRKLA